MPKAFHEEFRRDVVAVARRREAPVSQIAKDFGISEARVHRWLKLEDGVRPGRWKVNEVSDPLGVSRQTIHTWLARYE